MAVEERVELEGADDVNRALASIARSMEAVARSQDTATRSGKKKTKAEKEALKAVRAHRKALREQRRALRAIERQRQRNIRTLKSFVGGMTGAQFGAAALGAAIAALAAGAVKLALDFGEVANDLAKVGRAFGLTADDVAVLEFQLGRLTNGNVSATKALTAVVDAAGRAQQGMASYQRIFKDLTIDVEDGNDQLRSAEDLYDDVRRSIAGMATEQEAMAVATQLFGRRMAAELVPALRATDEEVSALEQRYFGLAGAIGDASVEAEAQADALLDMKTAAQGLRMEIGELLSPAITSSANALADAMGALRREMKEIAGGATASELAAQFDSVMALGREAASVQMEIERLQARPARTGAQEMELAFLSRRAVRLREAVHLLEAQRAAEADVTDQVERTAEVRRTTVGLMRAANDEAVKTLAHEKEIWAVLDQKAKLLKQTQIGEADAQLRLDALERQRQAYVDLMAAQQAANEATISGMRGVLDASASVVDSFSKGTDSALAKVLRIGSTVIGVVESITAATTAANAISAVQSATATTQATAELATIASVAAPAATLSSIAKGEQSIGTILAVVGAIIGGVASVAGIALAERGASPEFLRSLPAIDRKGHRMVGVMPNEKILDPGATRAQEDMLTQAARFFAAQSTPGGAVANGSSYQQTTIVNVGGRTVAAVVTDAERDIRRFGTSRGIA